MVCSSDVSLSERSEIGLGELTCEVSSEDELIIWQEVFWGSILLNFEPGSINVG